MNVLRRDFVVREPLLVAILVLIAVVFSTVTHAYSQAYDRRRNQLGQQWFATGNADLQKSQPVAAIAAFRTALLYDPQNWDYRLFLAEALTRAGHSKQALNYYQSLWQFNPRSGIVNLNLARFAAESGHADDAERYFNGAIFGDWPENAPDHRRQSLLELINFYLQRQDTGQAESQLIVLSANLPEDMVLRTHVGDLFMQVGDYQRALAQYRLAFQLSPKYLPALAGAGKASFQLGDYRSAETYLSRAAREDSAGSDIRNLLSVTQAAASLDTSEHGLPESEKIRRVLRAFSIASTRLDSCHRTAADNTLPSPLAALLEQSKQWKPNANARFLTQQPDQIDSLFEFAASIEKQSQSLCGQPTPEEAALLALANSHIANEK
jgi:tetratricopeptide (TPR) repeat protein